jgi:uncharacterized protein
MSDRAPLDWRCRAWQAAAIAAATVAGAAMLSVAPRAHDGVFVSLGTGELNGLYYPVGKAICQIVNRNLDVDGVRCSPETTPGSVYNIDAVRSGELEFAIVQSDVQFAAYHGTGDWRGRPFHGLRSVVSLYPELVTIMARAASRITNLNGLAGRRVSVGSRGSGTRATWDAIEAVMRWHEGERIHPVELRGGAAKSALCGGAIDANLLIVGYPSPLIAAQQAACAIKFVAVDGPAVDRLVRDHPYYEPGLIKGRAADGAPSEVPTFGVRATLVTSVAVDARVVAVVTRELLTHIAELRTLHPALSELTASEMDKGGATVPLHPGAAQVYKELDLRE